MALPNSITDPHIATIALISIAIIVISLLLKRLKQTYIIGYILIGVFVKEYGLEVTGNMDYLRLLGELGIILLLFFIGMEINLVNFLKQWKIAVLGVIAQLLFSLLFMFGMGTVFGWSTARIVVLGFVVALSSSAVVIKILQDKGLIDTAMGKNVLSILLAQDVAFVPLLLIISQLGGSEMTTMDLVLMSIGAILVVALLAYIYIKRSLHFPFLRRMEKDHELQFFVAVVLCFGGALVTSFFGLSAALGAFVGGMLINATRETHWIQDTLHSFRILFVSFFFIGIGLQIDLGFIQANMGAVGSAIVIVFLCNHLLNTLIIRYFSGNWKDAFLGGAYLAQIGELSFLLAATAFTYGIIEEFSYNFTISLISLTLIISPFWIALAEKINVVLFKKTKD
ncbi:cation:proton antiporter [Flagellimonas nanhaiensis]|uniref:Cation:proton antiporter n=1 Tax=Flagellimonas nanhaiensis TaxID=2292706 RepID=A0A371JNW4_9FLAO|nr:cation:proton antiporter [Allomuricauda nanhaiensis]RDY58922.1 cation:proton antiporter [Allomuricauda nanhaiensis]